jgi:hypothetical protein
LYNFSQGDSRKKESNAARHRVNVKVINFPIREEVKLNEAENAWKPPPKKEAEEDSMDDVELLCKRIRSILNKLCPQKSVNLVAQFNELETDMEEKLTKAIHWVSKAIDEPGYSVFYVMKKVLAENGCPINFRTLLLKRLNIFFEDFI